MKRKYTKKISKFLIALVAFKLLGTTAIYANSINNANNNDYIGIIGLTTRIGGTFHQNLWNNNLQEFSEVKMREDTQFKNGYLKGTFNLKATLSPSMFLYRIINASENNIRARANLHANFHNVPLEEALIRDAVEASFADLTSSLEILTGISPLSEEYKAFLENLANIIYNEKSIYNYLSSTLERNLFLLRYFTNRSLINLDVLTNRLFTYALHIYYDKEILDYYYWNNPDTYTRFETLNFSFKRGNSTSPNYELPIYDNRNFQTRLNLYFDDIIATNIGGVYSISWVGDILSLSADSFLDAALDNEVTINNLNQVISYELQILFNAGIDLTPEDEEWFGTNSSQIINSVGNYLHSTFHFRLVEIEMEQERSDFITPEVERGILLALFIEQNPARSRAHALISLLNYYGLTVNDLDNLFLEAAGELQNSVIPEVDLEDEAEYEDETEVLEESQADDTDTEEEDETEIVEETQVEETQVEETDDTEEEEETEITEESPSNENNNRDEDQTQIVSISPPILPNNIPNTQVVTESHTPQVAAPPLVLREALVMSDSIRNVLNKTFENSQVTRIENGTYQVTMPLPPQVTEETTLEELLQIVNIPLEFEIVSRSIANEQGDNINVYFFINDEGYLVFNVISTPLSVNINRYAGHSVHNNTRNRVNINTSAELLRLRMYFNRGDISLRQFIYLREQLLTN